MVGGAEVLNDWQDRGEVAHCQLGRHGPGAVSCDCSFLCTRSSFCDITAPSKPMFAYWVYGLLQFLETLYREN